MRFTLFLFATIILLSWNGEIYAQDNSVITGKVINGEDREPLSFALNSIKKIILLAPLVMRKVNSIFIFQNQKGTIR